MHLLLVLFVFLFLLLFFFFPFSSSLFSRVHATLQVTLSVCRLVGRSVGRSVGLSVPLCFFFAFLGYLKVGKHIFKCLVSNKQHLHPSKSPCRSVGPSVCLSRFAFVAFLSSVKVGKFESRQE